MLQRANAVVHGVSAIYCCIVLGIAFIFQPLEPSLKWYALSLLGLVFADVITAIKQWRRPPSGRLLSISIHFAVVLIVVVIMAVAFIESQGHRFPSWFAVHDFGFVFGLMLVRLMLAVVLLQHQDQS